MSFRDPCPKKLVSEPFDHVESLLALNSNGKVRLVVEDRQLQRPRYCHSSIVRYSPLVVTIMLISVYRDSR